MPSTSPLTISATHGPILFLFYFFQGQSGGSHEDGGGSPLSTSSGWGPQAQKTEVANAETRFAVQCVVLAFSLWLAANLSRLVSLLLWGCREPGMALCSGTGKTPVFGVCGCHGSRILYGHHRCERARTFSLQLLSSGITFPFLPLPESCCFNAHTALRWVNESWPVMQSVLFNPPWSCPPCNTRLPRRNLQWDPSWAARFWGHEHNAFNWRRLLERTLMGLFPKHGFPGSSSPTAGTFKYAWRKRC